MNIILLMKKNEVCTALRLGYVFIVAFVFFVVGLLFLCGYGGYKLAYYKQIDFESNGKGISTELVETWNDRLVNQKDEVTQLKKETTNQMEALTAQMAELQARLVRLDALGARLVEVAQMDMSEFNFSQNPAVGGPEDITLANTFETPHLLKSFIKTEKQIEQKQEQLEVLQNLLASRKLERDVFLSGQPVARGWVSSLYGWRTDPFNGRLAWHKGIDFAAKEGSSIVTVAAGVVTVAEKRKGYGLLVEINHGGDYVTRYGHCKKALVKVGDLVFRGQKIALIGNTGRSTGPHVHFEVLKNNRPVNPKNYIYRAGM